MTPPFQGWHEKHEHGKYHELKSTESKLQAAAINLLGNQPANQRAPKFTPMAYHVQLKWVYSLSDQPPMFILHLQFTQSHISLKDHSQGSLKAIRLGGF